MDDALLAAEDAELTFHEETPFMCEMLVKQGDILQKKGDYASALRRYSQILDAKVRYAPKQDIIAEAWAKRAQVLANMGKYVEALQAYKSGINVMETEPLLQGLGKLKRMLEEKGK